MAYNIALSAFQIDAIMQGLLKLPQDQLIIDPVNGDHMPISEFHNCFENVVTYYEEQDNTTHHFTE